MNQGFLAIWSDVGPADETDYLNWLTREHAFERLAVPGFLAVRVFRASVEGGARFLIFYRLRDAAVVGSAPYLARLNVPSPWSQTIMPKLKNFRRGGGSILQESGAAEGGYVAPVLFGRDALPAYREAGQEIAMADRMAAARILEVDPTASQIATSEKAMRAGDTSFEAMMLLEALDESTLAQGLTVMQVPEREIYCQIFAAKN